ncbi:MAG: phosphoribosyltransferase family protein [bacterium]|nr:phosphoribosyltransferase family protein [bacterium]
MSLLFRDRTDAGQKLAKMLETYRDKDIVVYGLPRGGVVLANIVANLLHAPLDLVITRKIGHPFSPEYAIGAVSENSQPILNEQETLNIDRDWLKKEIANQRQEAKRRRNLYLKGRESISAEGKTAIIIDDGIATGLTMFATIDELKKQKPKKIIVAIPVIPGDTYEKLKQLADEVMSIKVDENFLGAVGAYYENFSQVEDDEVIAIMKSA